MTRDDSDHSTLSPTVGDIVDQTRRRRTCRQCPDCGAPASVERVTPGAYRWRCTDDACPSVGFGFRSRYAAREALLERRESTRR